MDNVTVKVRRASFTVEAVFVMVIVVSVLLGLCYFTLYIHDKTIVPSLAHTIMEIKTNSGQSGDNEELSQALKKELEEHLFFMKVSSVKVKSGIYSLTAQVRWQTKRQVPFVGRLFFLKGTGTINVAHGTLSAPELMWDSKWIEGAAGNERNGN